jgi:hypothetical protein
MILQEGQVITSMGSELKMDAKVLCCSSIYKVASPIAKNPKACPDIVEEESIYNQLCSLQPRSMSKVAPDHFPLSPNPSHRSYRNIQPSSDSES